MIVTTTATVEGASVYQYLGIVTGEVTLGINIVRDMGAGIRNIVGGRSKGYEDEILRGRDQAIAEMVQRAMERGADAVIGVDMDYESLGTGGMLLVTAAGTAVKLGPPRA